MSEEMDITRPTGDAMGGQVAAPAAPSALKPTRWQRWLGVGAASPAAQQRAVSRSSNVGVWVLIMLGVVLAAVIGRVAQLQAAPELKLVPFIQERKSVLVQTAPRGELEDRRGRPLASTHMGYRAFVDPTAFPNPPGPAMHELAAALGEPESKFAEKLVGKMSDNEARAQEKKRPFRYVRVSDVLTDDQVETVKALKIKGVHLERPAVRDNPGGEAVASILGVVADNKGAFGAERAFNEAMLPHNGRMDYTRDASGRPLWVESFGYLSARRGEDVRLSVDLALQQIVAEEVERGVSDADAAGARCVLADPSTGEVLALVDTVRKVPGARVYSPAAARAAANEHVRWQIIKDDPLRDSRPALARNRCLVDVYEPGSTFKAFMWSGVTERHLAEPEEVFNTHNGEWIVDNGRVLKDVTPQPELSWANVLVYSSNIGMVQGTARLTFQQMHDDAVKYGFGTRTGLLPGESPGIVTPMKRFNRHTQISMSFGYEVAVTPVQMVRAFSVFARNGELAGTLPSLRLTAVDPEKAEPDVITRVLPKWTAMLAREIMSQITNNMEGKYFKDEPMPYRMFGKSGTAEVVAPGGGGYIRNQYNSSFIAGAPLENPRLVCIVVIDDPGPDLIAHRHHYGSAVAGPVVTRIMRRSLEYLGVPPDITQEQVAQTE